ncbi:hypothetical protein SAMN02745824_1966 [Parasphingorhabdus marina DSM 22363]|uniref:Uncharacterized protein n=1 Tax=Parasphingorhabdus marina DSM 22363 TaxID=1123272 RepID=A0A1N6EK28_9SPHN|nr:hypothetical protein [Parasphingorhabdus marina]SIN83402.1 hypothetical protein SAMN02745824_1966 [Parasphingorhabdus marina DSM 22363]
MASFLLKRLRKPFDASRQGAVLPALIILHMLLVLVVTVPAGM